jgi:dTDP-4-dehydrorhamnose reductase
MTAWLITGAAGMLGRELTALLSAEAEPVTGLARADLDITDATAVQAALERHHPDVVVNCAAWTAVDDAEAQEDAALAVNGQAVADLAIACARHAAILIHLSTDYVFDGTASDPYSESHPPRPGSAYGRTKLSGERAVLATLPETGYVVRTAWLYGAHGSSFVATMISHARAGRPASVVSDQRGQPTWTADVARQLLTLVTARPPAGIYHATSSGDTTWFELAREVYRQAGADPALVTPVGTTAYPRPAPRPAYSVLGHDAWACTGIRPIGSWQGALDRAFPAMVATSAGPDA